MNVVIYSRYSCDNQREESIEGQLRECQAYAERKGLTVINTYIDRAYSAKTDNRPEFKQMVKDSSKRKFDAILVWKLDRFARNRYDSAHYKALLRKNGVKVISATENISEDATGILLESMLEGYAEFYSAELSEKVIRGMTENALKCQFNGGGVPFGFTIDEYKHFQIDPVTAPIVEDIYKIYADGSTVKNITEYLKSIGITRKNGEPMKLDTVKLILTNRKYIGEYRYRDIVVPNGIPAIISDELFEKVQARIAKNKKAPARFKAKDDMYILSTKLFCGHCGAFMVGESGRNCKNIVYQYYKCANVKNKKGCDKKTVRKDFIENIVIETVNNFLKDDRFLADLSSRLYELQKKESSVIPKIKQQLSETNKALSNILSAIEQGIITETTKNRLEQLEKTKKDLEISLANEEIKHPLLSEENLLFWLKSFRKLDLEVPEQRQILVDNFVNAIYLYDDKIVLTFNFDTEKNTVTLTDINCSDMTVSVEPL